MKYLLFQVLLFTLAPCLVYARPALSDVYGDGAKAGPLETFIFILFIIFGILGSGEFRKGIFNIIKCFFFMCIFAFIFVCLMDVFVPIMGKGLFLFVFVLCSLFILKKLEKKSDNVSKKPEPNFENVKKVMHQPQQEPVVYVKKPTVQKASNDVVNNISSKKQHPLNRVVLHSKDNDEQS